MNRVTQALADARERHLGETTPENLRGTLLHVLEHDPRLQGPIPPAKRTRLKVHLEQCATRIFERGFLGRIADEPQASLHAGLELEFARLRREIHSLVLDWDRFLRAQGHQTHLQQRYPQGLLFRQLTRALQDIFHAGMQEGYRARKKRIGEELAHGLRPAAAEALLRQELQSLPRSSIAA